MTQARNYPYSRGRRTSFGVCPEFQDFTYTYLPDGYDYNVTDIDAVCFTEPYLALMEDKKQGAKPSRGQLATLEAIDVLCRAGSESLGPDFYVSVFGWTKCVTVNYTGLVFRTDCGANGHPEDVTHNGPALAIITTNQVEHFNLDAVIRDRSGKFMLVARRYRNLNDLSEGKATALKVLDALIKEGMKATGGTITVPSMDYPMPLKYHGLHLFEHDVLDIAAGPMYWDNEQLPLKSIIQKFTFQ
jgi:hypothetical protein